MATPDLIEDQGTVFRSALELAGKLLKPETESRVESGIKGEKIVVLLSDGEDHAGDFLAEAIKDAKRGDSSISGRGWDEFARRDSVGRCRRCGSNVMNAAGLWRRVSMVKHSRSSHVKRVDYISAVRRIIQ
jgi:hypothetical protein